MISLYVNFVKISEISSHVSADALLEHPLIDTHGATFTLDGGIVHSDFNKVELFLELRQHSSWAELNREFAKNPLKVYTRLTRGLPTPWLYVPYSIQAWFNGHLVLGYAGESKDATLLGHDEIIEKCRQSSKFDSTIVNTLTIYQGNRLRFSTVTYDITEDCSITSGHSIYIKRHTRTRV